MRQGGVKGQHAESVALHPAMWSARLRLAWVRVRDSLWFLPSLAVIVGTAMAMLAVGLPTPEPSNRFARMWLFGGGAEGARGVLTAIAGSLITVTGTIFSVTIVALQLASSQFTPRLLRSFVADRVNQMVLAIFIGTFTYTLLVLRTIHSVAGSGTAYVPQVAVTIALVLLLVSIGALIMFIDHAAQSIRAPMILHRETRRILAQISERSPTGASEAAPGEQPAQLEWVEPDGEPAVVTASESGYLQAVQVERLWRGVAGARSAPVTVRMELRVGAFAFPGKPLASVWPASCADEQCIDAIRAAFVLGAERTPEQDVEYGLVELSDIAVRALSPGINDPTTAVNCIDRLAEVLAAMGTRPPVSPLLRSPDGSVLFLTRETSFARAVTIAFAQVRHYAAGSPAILTKLLEALYELSSIVAPEDRAVLEEHAASAARAARRSIEDPSDLAELERLAALVVSADTRTPVEGVTSPD